MKRRNFYLVRHAESTDNADQNRFSGSSDPELTRRGRSQARKTAEYLSDRLEAIYCSPKIRAVRTAGMISKDEVKIIEDERLKEIDFGSWEGLTHEEIRNRKPEEYSAWEKDPYNNYPEGGEKPSDGLKRMIDLMEGLTEKTNAEEIGIVSHKCIIRMFLCWILERPISGYRKMKMDNSSISKVTHDSEGWNVGYINKVVY